MLQFSRVIKFMCFYSQTIRLAYSTQFMGGKSLLHNFLNLKSPSLVG